MNSLTVIHEEIEEMMPEECSELVQRLKDELSLALSKIQEYEEKLSTLKQNEHRVKELMNLCQSKNSEVFALERQVKDLIMKNEEKDKQIISMLSMAKDFKQLVETEDKFTQTNIVSSNEIMQKLVMTEEKNAKLKEMIISQIEEIQKLKSNEGTREMISGKRKVESKFKPSGYCPLFLRKPKDGSISHA